MTDETYNGWTNRETWAVDLMLSNDYGAYQATLERVRSERDDHDEPAKYTARHAGEAIRDMLTEEWFDPNEQLMTNEDIIVWLKEIGSLWRIDWDLIGEHWLSSINEEWPLTV